MKDRVAFCLTALMLLVVGSAWLALTQTYVAIDFPGATITEPNKINDSGVIVGFWRPADGIAKGFMDVGGTLSLFNYPEAYATQAHGINNAGAIVGRIRFHWVAPWSTTLQWRPMPMGGWKCSYAASTIPPGTEHRRRQADLTGLPGLRWARLKSA